MIERTDIGSWVRILLVGSLRQPADYGSDCGRGTCDRCAVAADALPQRPLIFNTRIPAHVTRVSGQPLQGGTRPNLRPMRSATLCDARLAEEQAPKDHGGSDANPAQRYEGVRLAPRRLWRREAAATVRSSWSRRSAARSTSTPGSPPRRSSSSTRCRIGVISSWSCACTA